ncbi:MAG: hypothetical protein ACLUOI_21835 [Eisenbergiella sp.]
MNSNPFHFLQNRSGAAGGSDGVTGGAKMKRFEMPAKPCIYLLFYISGAKGAIYILSILKINKYIINIK